MSSYVDLPGFENLYLQDSWVLGLHETEKTFHIDLEAVLTPEHPAWHDRKPGEQHPYRPVRIQFDNVQSVEWMDKHLEPTTDPDGSVDFGNIDSFEYDGNRYEVQGGWGHVVVITPTKPLVHDL